jgi:signal transduction histidine kinase
MAKAGILIVEDSFIVAYHLQCTLEAEGYEVLGKCDSGEAAITFMETHKPDLVLMDIMLAGNMDGIVAAGIMKSRFNAPVIYITALTDKDTIGRAKLTEPYGYLTKPFEDREIFTVIEMALYKHDIELRLRQSEEKYFSTVNSISDCVVAINRDYCISYMNPSAVALTQWPLSEALDRPVTEIMNLRNDTTQEMFVNPVQCAIGMGNANQMPDDLILTGRHGLTVPIGESSLSPLLDNKGHFAGLIIVFKNITEKKEHEKLISELKREKMAGLIEGQEKERGRIAKDLHDGLGQILNAIKMNISMIVASHEEANNVAKLLDEAIQESVRISENLLPAKLRDFDLSVCLKSLCKNIQNATPISLTFATHGDDFCMNHSQKVNFYRIAQEAINNSIKHASATNIAVQLNADADSIRMSIEDNGKGIPHERPSSFSRQNGLTNMRDRAEIMGGKLTIESDSHRGTLVIVEVEKLKLALHDQS